MMREDSRSSLKHVLVGSWNPLGGLLLLVPCLKVVEWRV